VNKINQISDFISYKRKATNEHGIHSPFIFELYNNVIADENPFYVFDDIESIRALLLLSPQEIDIKDYGAGSTVNSSNKRKISDIAKNTLKAPKYGQLLFRIVNRFKPKTVLELGTSLGISSMYLAAVTNKTNVTTVEGCPKTAQVAQINFDKIGIKNIKLINDKFDDFLPVYLKGINTLDLAFFDGNHTQKATLNYFNLCLEKANNNSVFIFDDIHWSKGMSLAWEEIKAHPKVTTTIDLFAVGIVFFNTDLSKEHFVLKY